MSTNDGMQNLIKVVNEVQVSSPLLHAPAAAVVPQHTLPPEYHTGRYLASPTTIFVGPLLRRVPASQLRCAMSSGGTLPGYARIGWPLGRGRSEAGRTAEVFIE